MIEKIKLDNILFLDIETVPCVERYDLLPAELQMLWDKKAKSLSKYQTPPEEMFQRAGIYAEFGKIICISVGYIRSNKTKRNLRIKSFYGDDEKVLLENFCQLLNESFNTEKHCLCAHNGKEFDFPYIARRCLLQGVKLPLLLKIAGKKPWEIKHVDTMELWKFGDYKHYTSLALLTTVFGIPTPKDDIDGSDVANVYYREKNLFRIVRYCEKDVVAIVQLFLKYRIEPIIPEQFITFVGINEEG